jgi:hypothetical protein
MFRSRLLSSHRASMAARLSRARTGHPVLGRLPFSDVAGMCPVADSTRASKASTVAPCRRRAAARDVASSGDRCGSIYTRSAS